MLTNKLIFCFMFLAAVPARPNSSNDVEWHVFNEHSNETYVDSKAREINITREAEISEEKAELMGIIAAGKKLAERVYNRRYEVLIRQLASYIIKNDDIPLDAKVRAIRFRRMQQGARVNKFLSHYEFNVQGLRRIHRHMVCKVWWSLESKEVIREAKHNYNILVIMETIAEFQEEHDSL